MAVNKPLLEMSQSPFVNTTTAVAQNPFALAAHGKIEDQDFGNIPELALRSRNEPRGISARFYAYDTANRVVTIRISVPDNETDQKPYFWFYVKVPIDQVAQWAAHMSDDHE